ncbi:MAG: exodeoxyribonuclease VII large subunit [Clostridia bacterium]|nr:exodeoxyribonuclease VII large subunit [Clostridia bacterium]
MNAVTVSQLNRYVRSLLDGDANLKGVWISGEISNFTNHYQSGHLYMTLKDEGAAVKAVMFRSQAVQLRFLPENGMKVLVRARVSLYEKDGAFQLYIDEMQPDGAGALQIAFEQLKRRLEAEGLFDESRKKALPRMPMRVGVITSPTGAAVRDILNVLSRRFPCATVVFAPVLVQGEGAPADLRRALLRFEEMKEDKHPQTPDVIIIGRGGGSIEELWAFNDEGLARTVASMTIPVISGVGHETDFTICDFVADLRAPTPSAAAELAVPDRAELLQTVGKFSQSMAAGLLNGLRQKSQRLQTIADRPCLSRPLYYVEERGVRLDYVTRAFSSAARSYLTRSANRLGTLAGKLDAISPLRVIARGYAVASKEGTVLTSVEQVNVGERVSILVEDGRMECLVETTVKGDTANE